MQRFYIWSGTTGPHSNNRLEQRPISLVYIDMHSPVRASQVAQRVKCLPAMWETQVRSLDQEDPLEKEMATHSGTLA